MNVQVNDLAAPRNLIVNLIHVKDDSLTIVI